MDVVRGYDQPKVSELAQEFGQYVRQRREALGFTLTDFAKVMGFSLAYLSTMERGLARPPSEANIVKMADKLGEDPDALLAMAGRLRRSLLAKVWASPLMPGVISSATGMEPGTAEKMAKTVAAFLQKAEADEASP